jgi:hypothetical protein
MSNNNLALLMRRHCGRELRSLVRERCGDERANAFQYATIHHRYSLLCPMRTLRQLREVLPTIKQMMGLARRSLGIPSS